MKRAPGASRVKKYPGNFCCNMPSDQMKPSFTILAIYSEDDFWDLVNKGVIKTSFKRT